MNKYSAKLEEIKTQKEKFVEDFVNDFDAWFEKNKEKKFDLSLKQIEDFLTDNNSSNNL